MKPKTPKIVLKKRSQIKRYPENPRKNEAGLKPVRKSIKEFGFVQPVVLDTDGVIIIGHTRFDASEELEEWAEAVPTVTVDLPPEKVRALRIADNSTHEFATWDHTKLMSELDAISTAGFGDEMQDFFNGFDVAAELKKMHGGDTTPPAGGTTKTATFNYKPQYGVIVICENAAQQEKVYNDLNGRGMQCKVVTT